MTSRAVRCYQYVDRSYERVRTALRQEGKLFQAATRAASARTDALATTLRIGMQGFEVGVDVHIQVLDVHDEVSAALKSKVTRVRLGWQAARATSLFPQMEATLTAWPMSQHETMIEIDGAYTPPLGAVGQALDALIFHRIAEAAVHRFLEDVVEQLRRELSAV